MLTIQYARAFPRWRVHSASPGPTATDFVAPREGLPTVDQLRAAGVKVNTVCEGAEILVRMATSGPAGPTGTFVGNEGPVPW